MAAVAVILTVGAFGLEVYHTVHNQFKLMWYTMSIYDITSF